MPHLTARPAAGTVIPAGQFQRIELVVDDLAVAYPRTSPAELQTRVRKHLGYVTGLLDGRATLARRRRLLVSGGWLSLLAATALTDLRDITAPVSYLDTAALLAAGNRAV